MSHLSRLLGILIAVAISAAAIASQLPPLPTGPWVGMYTAFGSVWLLLGGAVIGSIIWIGNRRRPLPWLFVTLIGYLAVIIIINLSQLWGIPFGIRDPWTHLQLIHSNTFGFWENPYPLFHILLDEISIVVGIAPITSLEMAPLISGVVGLAGIINLGRRIELNKWAQQVAYLAAAPSVFAGFIARPFTLGIALGFFFFWVVLYGDYGKHGAILSLIFLVSLLWIHPVILLSIGVTGAVWAILYFLNRRGFSNLLKAPPTTFASRFPYLLLILIAVVPVTYFFLATQTGIVLGARVLGIVSSEAAATSTGQQNAEIISKIFNNISEFLKRTSFPVLLGVSALGAIAYELFQERRLHWATLLSFVSSGVLAMIFVMLQFFPGIAFGIPRVVMIAPILLFPAFARGLQTPFGRRGILAACVVIAGGATAFDSDLTGGIQQSAGTAQVDGYQWLHAYYTEGRVIGSGSTFWIASGLFGESESDKWGGTYQYKTRPEKFAWQVTAPSEDAIYAVSGFERALARQSSTDQNRFSSLQSLQSFQHTNNRIYNNGNLRLYQNTTHRSR